MHHALLVTSLFPERPTLAFRGVKKKKCGFGGISLCHVSSHSKKVVSRWKLTNRLMRQLIQRCCLLSLLLLVGCTTKVAYNFMDWAIEWKLRRFVSLHDEQKVQVKAAIDEFHLWHRHTQLPQYAAYLTSLASRLQNGPISPEEIHAETDKIQLLMDQSLAKILPHIAITLAQLSDKQAAQIVSAFAEERNEYIDDYVDIPKKKQIRKRYEEFADYFEPWTGSLNQVQKKRIQAWSENLEPYESLNAQQQLAWEIQLEKLLVQRQHPAQLQSGLQALMFYRTDNWNPQLQQIMDKNQAATYQLLADLINTLSEKQRAHFVHELQHYAKICLELANHHTTPK